MAKPLVAQEQPDILLPSISEWKLKALLPPPCGLLEGSGFRSGRLQRFCFLAWLSGLQGQLCSSPSVCSGRCWRGEIFPPDSALFGAQGKWEELWLWQTSQWELPGKLLSRCGLQADLLILGRKAELDTLKREGRTPSFSQVPEYPHSGGCVGGEFGFPRVPDLATASVCTSPYVCFWVCCCYIC